jgi:hypothetical protein
LDWSERELKQGKLIKVKGFPKDYKVKLFRVVVSSKRTEWLVTNDLTRNSTQDAQEVRGVRWKIEEFHREAKQLTGIESCQCRAGRIQRNHIACALLVWSRLKNLAYQNGRTVYRIKRGLLHDYLVQQLKAPLLRWSLRKSYLVEIPRGKKTLDGRCCDAAVTDKDLLGVEDVAELMGVGKPRSGDGAARVTCHA